MKFHSKTERWELQEGPTFLYTQIIFQGGYEYYWARSQSRWNDADYLNINALQPQKIPREHLWPLVEGFLTQYTRPERSNIYLKQPRLNGYNSTPALSSLLLQEARVCEALIQSPHPNVAQYLGCIVEEGRIMGICFERYKETLAERIEGGGIVNPELYQGIENGVKHLHAIDLIHNDLNPDNIMFRSHNDDTPIIIDFDSCAFKGEPLPGKRGPVPDGIDTAEIVNDELGLSRIRNLLYDQRKC